jgi:AmiR/NasT family two-component response regulator
LIFEPSWTKGIIRPAADRRERVRRHVRSSANFHGGRMSARPPVPFRAQAACFRATARRLKIRSIRQLVMVGDLVIGVSALIHSLQRERGISNVYIGSGGKQFADRLAQAAEASRAGQANVLDLLQRLHEVAREATFDARLFSRIGCVLDAFADIEALRARILACDLSIEAATTFFVEIISSLLAVVFEASDASADPEVSRALIAMFNFMQGKEFAGQERATTAAGLTMGGLTAVQHERLLQLIDAQTRSFQIFARFASDGLRALHEQALSGPEMIEFERLRRIACLTAPGRALVGIASEQWYDQATRRIDAMRVVEQAIDDDLRAISQRKLEEAERADDPPAERLATVIENQRSVAFVIGEADQTLIDAAEGAGAGVYSVDGVSPRLGRSILDLVESQAHHLRQMSEELEAAKGAINERKTIDRAKGLLMSHRGLSEPQAYEMLRKTAMSQNRRIKEVAEAVLSMADILKAH